jgi:hypothetical protein
VREYGLSLYGSGQEKAVGFFEHDNALSGFIKCWKFLDYLINYQLLKKNSVAFN